MKAAPRECALDGPRLAAISELGYVTGVDGSINCWALDRYAHHAVVAPTTPYDPAPVMK